MDKELLELVKEELKRKQALVHTYNKALEGRTAVPADAKMLHGMLTCV